MTFAAIIFDFDGVLVDGTWSDSKPLEDAYRNDKRRQGLPDYSDTYRDSLTHAPVVPRRFDIDPAKMLATPHAHDHGHGHTHAPYPHADHPLDGQCRCA